MGRSERTKGIGAERELLLSFTVPGVPRGKGRPRFARQGKTVISYTDAETASYENLVALASSQAKGNAPPLDCPIELIAWFILPRPKSAPKRRTAPDRRPDLDNLLKAVLDGINASGAWTDDSRVCRITAGKLYCDEAEPTPRAIITLWSCA